MANATTTTTGSESTNVVTFKTKNVSNGVSIYCKYAKGGGTSATITFTIKNSSLGTDAYQYWDSSSLTVAAEVYTFATSGNYRIALPMALGEDTLIATVAFTGGSDQTMNVDMNYGT